MSDRTIVQLSCPRCDARVRSVTLMVSATLAVDRKCRNGHTWRVIIRPLSHGERMSFHKVEWQPL